MQVLDFGALIGARNVCVRVGNMCASWIHQYLGISGSIRISVGAYNTIDEIKQVIGFIKDIVK
jgi:cysteine desulfurase/selenocysteine lyase